MGTETLEQKIAWTKEYILSGQVELTEALNEIPWKKHRSNAPMDRDALLEELVDALNYNFAILDMWEFGGEDVLRVWNEKYVVLQQRYYQEKEAPLRAGQEVLMVDLDGSVVNFRQGIWEFLHNHFPQLVQGKPDPEQRYALHEDLGCSKEEWDDAFAAFCVAGGFRELPWYPGAVETLSNWANEYTLVFVTSRPKSVKRVYRDTLLNIKEALPGIKFHLYFEHDKAAFLKNSQTSVVAVVEDHPSTVLQMLDEGYKVVLLDRPYNEHLPEHAKMFRISGVDELGWRL